MKKIIILSLLSMSVLLQASKPASRKHKLATESSTCSSSETARCEPTSGNQPTSASLSSSSSHTSAGATKKKLFDVVTRVKPLQAIIRSYLGWEQVPDVLENNTPIRMVTFSDNGAFKAYAGTCAPLNQVETVIENSGGEQAVISTQYQFEIGTQKLSVARAVPYFYRRSKIRRAAFSDNYATIAALLEDKTIQVWNAASGKPVIEYEDADPAVCCIDTIALSPDGNAIAYITLNCHDVAPEFSYSLKLVDLDTQKIIKNHAIATRNFSWAKLSPDKRLFVGFDDHARSVIYDMDSGKIKDIGFTFRINNAVAFSPNNRYMVTPYRHADSSIKIRMADLTTGNYYDIPDQEGDINSLSVSDDGVYIAATGRETGSQRLWKNQAREIELADNQDEIAQRTDKKLEADCSHIDKKQKTQK